MPCDPENAPSQDDKRVDWGWSGVLSLLPHPLETEAVRALCKGHDRVQTSLPIYSVRTPQLYYFSTQEQPSKGLSFFNFFF